MRCMTINKQAVYHAEFAGRKEILDDEGFKTGEFETGYTEPALIMAVVSASTGESTIELFGNLTGYDKVITIDDPSCKINEKSKIWIDAKPDQEADYEVLRVAKSLNFVSYAIKQVAKNGN